MKAKQDIPAKFQNIQRLLTLAKNLILHDSKILCSSWRYSGPGRRHCSVVQEQGGSGLGTPSEWRESFKRTDARRRTPEARLRRRQSCIRLLLFEQNWNSVHLSSKRSGMLFEVSKSLPYIYCASYFKGSDSEAAANERLPVPHHVGDWACVRRIGTDIGHLRVERIRYQPPRDGRRVLSQPT